MNFINKHFIKLYCSLGIITLIVATSLLSGCFMPTEAVTVWDANGCAYTLARQVEFGHSESPDDYQGNISVRRDVKNDKPTCKITVDKPH